ncbi:MAG: hypothetical protein EOM78_18125 [Erysipelotrichia bacterium]|nr:hypothetical protein [Erysipelotrichia bacterium]
MNKPLIAGDIKFWIEGWSVDKREAPLSFKYNENLLDLTWQFSIEVPDTDNYAFAKLPFKECRVYLNGDFFCGGYAIRFSEGDTSYNCEFIGYGYQVAKLTLLQSIQGTLPTNMAIRDFLNLVINLMI